MSDDSLGGANPAPADLVLDGRYRLLEPAGAGGMAVVWQAWDTVLARTVAVKLLSARYAGDPRSRARVQHEARAAAALTHPNVAQVHDYGESVTDGQVLPYVVMELVRGDTLQRRLKGGPVSTRFAMRVCAEVGAALAAAHAEGLVHRDIKPANIMLAGTGAKVVDFGIAAAVAPGGSGMDEVFGTPTYIAPERLTDDAVQPASDVYALGVLLYQLLSGQSPWVTENTTQLLAAHVHLDPAPLMPRSPVPDHVVELCMRCLSKDPARRPSASEVARLLAHAAGLTVVEDEPTADRAAATAAGRAVPATDYRAMPATDTEPSVLIRPPVVVPPPARRRAVRRRAVAGALAVTALAAAGWALLPGGPLPAGPAAAPSAAVGSGAGASPAMVPAPSASGATSAAAQPRPGDPTRGTSTGAARSAKPAGTTAATTADATPPGTTPPTEPTTEAPEPVERAFSTTGGTVTATCTDATTAQILSSTAIRPYKVQAVDSEPGSAPAVTFKHGNDLITVTVTCSGSVPSSTVT